MIPPKMSGYIGIFIFLYTIDVFVEAVLQLSLGPAHILYVAQVARNKVNHIPGVTVIKF